MVLRFTRGLLQHILIPGFPRTFVNDVEHTVPRFFVYYSMGKPRILLCFWNWKPILFAEMKRTFLLLVAIAACFNSFCQMKNTELENLANIFLILTFL